MKGKLIVFEGSDGTGKTTQAKLLLDFLKSCRVPTEYISFPRYKDSLWGQMVRRYLDGEFGEIDEVNPYLASVLYAGDRFSASTQIKKWLKEGKIVVCNRYVGSNLAHQAAKLQTSNSKLQFMKWLEKLEYEENKIPKEDLVILLHVPVSISRKLISHRKLDIHERDLAYLERVIDVYESLAKGRKNWVKVECVKNGKISPFPLEKIYGRLNLVDVTTQYDTDRYNGRRSILYHAEK
jgi:dTMP kinase